MFSVVSGFYRYKSSCKGFPTCLLPHAVLWTSLDVSWRRWRVNRGWVKSAFSLDVFGHSSASMKSDEGELVTPGSYKPRPGGVMDFIASINVIPVIPFLSE